MTKVARVILTLDCRRDCEDCANTQEMLASAQEISSYLDLDEFEEVCITGGEPILEPRKVLDFASGVKSGRNAWKDVYVYLSDWDDINQVADVLRVVDGMHYTIHKDSSLMDMSKFVVFQDLARSFPDRSFRLFIHPECGLTIPLVTDVWSRVEMKPWVKGCPLPADETLFILKGLRR